MGLLSFLVLAIVFLPQPVLALVQVDKTPYFSFKEEVLKDWQKNWQKGQIRCLSYNQQTKNLDSCDEISHTLMQQFLNSLSYSYEEDVNTDFYTKSQIEAESLRFVSHLAEDFIFKDLAKSHGIKVASLKERICAKSHRPLLQKGTIILIVGLSSGVVTGVLIGGVVSGIVVTVGASLVTSIVLVGNADSVDKPGNIEKEIGNLIGVSSGLNFICSS